jgi:hypothetical protein
MGFETHAARQIDGVRRDVVDRGRLVVAGRGVEGRGQFEGPRRRQRRKNHWRSCFARRRLQLDKWARIRGRRGFDIVLRSNTDLDRRRFEPCKALLGPDRLLWGIRSSRRQGRRRSLERRQGGRSRFRSRGCARRERYEKSGQAHGDDGKTDPNNDRKDDRSTRFGRNAGRRRGDRLLRGGIATGIVRRGESLPPSRIWLLSGEQDEALVFPLRRTLPRAAQGRSSNLPSKYE